MKWVQIIAFFLCQFKHLIHLLLPNLACLAGPLLLRPNSDADIQFHADQQTAWFFFPIEITDFYLWDQQEQDQVCTKLPQIQERKQVHSTSIKANNNFLYLSVTTRMVIRFKLDLSKNAALKIQSNCNSLHHCA